MDSFTDNDDSVQSVYFEYFLVKICLYVLNTSRPVQSHTYLKLKTALVPQGPLVTEAHVSQTTFIFFFYFIG